MGDAREGGHRWNGVPLRERLRVLRRCRHAMAREAGVVAAGLSEASGRPEAEVLSAQVLPLLEACRFLERRAGRVLRRRRMGPVGRPLWLWGVRSEVRRVPWGVVLMLGASNYPLFLPGVQALQAVAAGNAVMLKPGRGGTAAAERLAGYLRDAGLPEGVLTVTGEGVGEAERLLDAGPDKVVLTGSSATGRAVLRRCAELLIPVTCELSGCDAVFVLPGADVGLVARSVAFGVGFNGGQTCIAPRRVVVVGEGLNEVVAALRGVGVEGCRQAMGDGPDASPVAVAPGLASAWGAWGAGGVSVVAVADVEEALRVDGGCGYALGASVFGPRREAYALAGRLDAGSVCVNDVIVPTADPRLPFGPGGRDGRGESGFGVTRGAEGLLAMTRPKTISVRRVGWRGGLRKHLDEPNDGDAGVLAGYARWVHGGIGRWFGK